MDKLYTILDTCWRVTVEMAPWLLIGFAVAGALRVLISSEWVQRHLGGRGGGPVVKATLFGVPLPLCSCGVIPVTAGMIRQGAGRGASSAFLISTPQTGVDSILATYALLGPVFAVVRPIVALVGGVIGGLTIDAVHRDAPVPPGQDDAQGQTCHTGAGDTQTGGKLRRAVRYGLVTLPGDIGWSVILGIAITGVITAFVGRGRLEPYLGGGMLAMLLMVLVGTPIYVCATGSIPLALGFIHMGASPGAALAFLIAGPATNATTIAVTWKMLGRRATVIYLMVVLVSALAAGWVIDTIGVTLPLLDALGDHAHGHVADLAWYEHALGTALLAVLVIGLIGRHRPAGDHAANTSDVELPVEGMTCSHCAETVAGALKGTPGVTDARVDLAGGRAFVTGNADREKLAAAVRAVGFGVPD